MSSAPVHEGKFFAHQKTDLSFLSAETQADQRLVDRMSNHVRFSHTYKGYCADWSALSKNLRVSCALILMKFCHEASQFF